MQSSPPSSGSAPVSELYRHKSHHLPHSLRDNLRETKALGTMSPTSNVLTAISGPNPTLSAALVSSDPGPNKPRSPYATPFQPLQRGSLAAAPARRLCTQPHPLISSSSPSTVPANIAFEFTTSGNRTCGARQCHQGRGVAMGLTLQTYFHWSWFLVLIMQSESLWPKSNVSLWPVFSVFFFLSNSVCCHILGTHNDHHIHFREFVSVRYIF